MDLYSESAATTLPTGQFVTVAVTLGADGRGPTHRGPAPAVFASWSAYS